MVRKNVNVALVDYLFVRTDDLLILFDIWIRYDVVFILRENYYNENVRKECHFSKYSITRIPITRMRNLDQYWKSLRKFTG